MNVERLDPGCDPTATGLRVYHVDTRAATSASPFSSKRRDLTLDPSCSITHAYASRSTVSDNGIEWEARILMMFATREMAALVAGSMS